MSKVLLSGLCMLAVGCMDDVRPSRQADVQIPTVCGAWVSVTSSKRYVFICHGHGAFDVAHGIVGLGDGVMGSGMKIIGDGMQIGDSVTATIDIEVEGQVRRALLRLRLQGHRDLVGTFVGKERNEGGNIRFVRHGLGPQE